VVSSALQVGGAAAAKPSRAGCKTLYPHDDCTSLALGLSDVIVDPANPRIVLVFIANVVWVSRDGGHSWITHRLPPTVAEGTGQDPGSPRGFAFSKDGTTIVEPAVNGWAEISHDLGASWTLDEQAGIGVPQNIVADPATPKGLWGCAGNGYDADVAHSADDGLTWTLVKNLGAYRTCGEVEPQPAGNVLLATVDLNGTHRVLFRSADGGQTWQRVAGVYFAADSSRVQQELAWDPTRPDTVLAVAGVHASDPARTILRSTNAGLTWRVAKKLRLRPHPGNCGFDQLAVSHQGVALVNFGCEKNEHGGFYVSRSHGKEWKRVRVPRAPHGGVWDFFPDVGDPQILIPQGSSILFYSQSILAYIGRAPFWHLSANDRSMVWYGGFRAAGA
jgi:hypothetical protein